MKEEVRCKSTSVPSTQSEGDGIEASAVLPLPPGGPLQECAVGGRDTCSNENIDWCPVRISSNGPEASGPNGRNAAGRCTIRGANPEPGNTRNNLEAVCHIVPIIKGVRTDPTAFRGQSTNTNVTVDYNPVVLLRKSDRISARSFPHVISKEIEKRTKKVKYEELEEMEEGELSEDGQNQCFRSRHETTSPDEYVCASSKGRSAARKNTANDTYTFKCIKCSGMYPSETALHLHYMNTECGEGVRDLYHINMMSCRSCKIRFMHFNLAELIEHVVECHNKKTAKNANRDSERIKHSNASPESNVLPNNGTREELEKNNKSKTKNHTNNKQSSTNTRSCSMEEPSIEAPIQIEEDSERNSRNQQNEEDFDDIASSVASIDNLPLPCLDCYPEEFDESYPKLKPPTPRPPENLELLLEKLLKCPHEKCKLKFDTVKKSIRHLDKDHYEMWCPGCFSNNTKVGNVWKDHIAKHHFSYGFLEQVRCFYCRTMFNYDKLLDHILDTHIKKLENENKKKKTTGLQKEESMEREGRNEERNDEGDSRSTSHQESISCNHRTEIPARRNERIRSSRCFSAREPMSICSRRGNRSGPKSTQFQISNSTTLK